MKSYILRILIFLCLYLDVVVQSYILISSNVIHRQPSSSSRLTMGGGKGVATTRPGKEATVESVREQLNGVEMIFSVPSSSLKVNQVTTLRKSLPEGTTARVVKNTLMRKAVEGTEWEIIRDNMTSGENMWFFVQNDVSASIKSLKDFLKDVNKDESHLPKYGVIEGNALDAAGVETISNLPSKKELYRQIAIAINSIPTNLARSINLVPTKVARSIKLAFADEEKRA